MKYKYKKTDIYNIINLDVKLAKISNATVENVLKASYNSYDFFCLTDFCWIFYLFIFQILSPCLSFPSTTTYLFPLAHASMWVLPYPPTYSHLTTLAFPYNGTLSSQD